MNSKGYVDVRVALSIVAMIGFAADVIAIIQFIGCIFNSNSDSQNFLPYVVVISLIFGFSVSLYKYSGEEFNNVFTWFAYVYLFLGAIVLARLVYLCGLPDTATINLDTWSFFKYLIVTTLIIILGMVVRSMSGGSESIKVMALPYALVELQIVYVWLQSFQGKSIKGSFVALVVIFVYGMGAIAACMYEE